MTATPLGLLCTVIAAIGLLAGCGRPAPNAWTMKFSHVYAANTDYQRMAERFRDLMAERTGGRFRVVIYPSGQLGDERVAFEQLRFGAQQIAISGTPVLSGWVPEGQIFDLPFLFATREEGAAALDGPLGDWWRELLLAKTGVRLLGFLEYERDAALLIDRFAAHRQSHSLGAHDHATVRPS